MVVRHVRSTCSASVVWAIDSMYIDTFKSFTVAELGPHAIAGLPALPEWPHDGVYRIAWVNEAKKLANVQRAFGCGVHPWGWRRGNIVDAVLDNAGIQQLAVPRRPWLPVEVADVQWGDEFLRQHQLVAGRYAVLEYVSHSLKRKPAEWFIDLVKHLRLPTISLAASGDPLLPGTIDGRGTSFQQAKALIAKSKVFIGCGSGLSVLAATHGCEQAVVEVVDASLSMVGIGYRRSGDRHKCLLPNSLPKAVADVVNSFR
jgi:hypothetical protein